MTVSSSPPVSDAHCTGVLVRLWIYYITFLQFMIHSLCFLSVCFISFFLLFLSVRLSKVFLYANKCRYIPEMLRVEFSTPTQPFKNTFLSWFLLCTLGCTKYILYALIHFHSPAYEYAKKKNYYEFGVCIISFLLIFCKKFTIIEIVISKQIKIPITNYLEIKSSSFTFCRIQCDGVQKNPKYIPIKILYNKKKAPFFYPHVKKSLNIFIRSVLLKSNFFLFEPPPRAPPLMGFLSSSFSLLMILFIIWPETKISYMYIVQCTS